ncbi:MAG TPA: hypothetical protein VN428_09015 [Bryobacteraceae bacterium]|nr:hypothetical protein [Bryobacteraceae bacterium]
MIRLLYVGLIRLHPRQFRSRHGEEMLSAFDDAALDGSAGRLRLLGDGLASLVRQWMLRPAAQGAVAQPVEGVPLFRTLDGGMPERAALAYGCVLALASFGVLAAAALRGAGRLPSWRAFETVQRQVYAPQRWPAASFMQSSPVRTPTLFEELDRDGDGVLSAAEIDGATATLMTLLARAPEATRAAAPPAPAESGSPSAAGSQPRRQPAPRGGVSPRTVVYLDPLLAAFDLNQDGWLSQHELDYAPVVLSGLDWNRDGKLSPDEIR